MKTYFIKSLPFDDLIENAFRDKEDIVLTQLRVINLLCTIPADELICTENDADLILIVDKMSRVFFVNQDKIHSLHFPFYISQKNGKFCFMLNKQEFGNREVTILETILRTIIDENNCDFWNDVEIFSETMEIHGVSEQDSNRYWKMLLDLLNSETGYIRYDHDEENHKPNHPVDHLDVFYESGTTFKIGLKNGIDAKQLEQILNINEHCWYIS